MGYRSQIVFVVEKPLVNKLLTLFSMSPDVREMLTYDNDLEQSPDGDMLFQINGVKWYDSYPEVRALTDWMDARDEDDQDSHYSFNRLGEEYGDHESRGFAEAWEVCPSQSLYIGSY